MFDRAKKFTGLTFNMTPSLNLKVLLEQDYQFNIAQFFNTFILTEKQFCLTIYLLTVQFLKLTRPALIMTQQLITY